MAPSRASGSGAGATDPAPPMLSRSHLKYSRLNLNIDQHGELDSRMGLMRRPRIVSALWWEKWVMLLQFIQFHGLMWLVAQPYAPYEWRDWIRWVLWFNLDFATYRADLNESSDFVANSVIVMCAPYALLGLYTLCKKTVYQNCYEGNEDDEPHFMSHLYFEKFCALIADLLYIPCLIVLFRFFSCFDGHALYETSSMTCWSGSHVVLIIFGCALTITYLIALPLGWHHRCYRLIIFKDQLNHERFLRSREIEYMMGVNTLYETTHFHLIASYRRKFVHWHFWSCLHRFILVLFVFFPSPAHARDDITQSVLFFITLVIPPIIKISIAQYRIWSSNRARIILDWTLVITNLFGIFQASHLRSSFLVATTLSRIFVSINCVGFGLFICICIWTYYRQHQWPVTMKHVKELCDGNSQVIYQLNAGKRLLEEGHTTPDEFFPRQPVLDTINSIRSILRDFVAKRDGTYVAPSSPHHTRRKKNVEFTSSPRIEQQRAMNKIGGMDPHDVLEWTLQDMVEDLALMYNNYMTRTRALGEHAMLQQDKFQSMMAHLAGFAASQQRKNADRILMRPYQRDLLQKLVVVRALLGDKFTFDPDRPRFQPYPIVDGFASDAGATALDSMSSSARAPPPRTRTGPTRVGAVSPVMEMTSALLKKDAEEQKEQDGDGDELEDEEEMRKMDMEFAKDQDKDEQDEDEDEVGDKKREKRVEPDESEAEHEDESDEDYH